MPRYRRDDRTMPLYISIRIEFYNGIARFLSHSTTFLYQPYSILILGVFPLHQIAHVGVSQSRGLKLHVFGREIIFEVLIQPL